MKSNKHYFYVLLTNDNTYYAGYTINPARRLKDHNDGVGAKYTRLKKRRPVKMIHLEKFATRSEATAAEAAFKNLTREQKRKYLNINKLNVKQSLKMKL
ncbi:MAG: GIY-YIG nuclease family protein [Streptococcaceae bacterium]|jgi:putative endonuclease|nr:GIY-YIG nuclease family protein [Streptococcaceae bacterium]